MDLLKRIIGIILVAAVVTALVLLVVGFIRSRATKTQTTTVTTTSTEVAPVSPTVVNTTNTTQPEPVPQTGTTGKSYNSMGNTLAFPNWGVMTCSNSNNFELDPTNNSDNRVVCDIAQKPITVMVNSNLACKGQPTTIGNIGVTKYRVENVRGVDYQWCFSKNGVNYNITHRVSASGARGTSVEDYSSKVEEIIGSVR